jgi:hypothetical protein
MARCVAPECDKHPIGTVSTPFGRWKFCKMHARATHGKLGRFPSGWATLSKSGHEMPDWYMRLAGVGPYFVPSDEHADG